MKPYIKAVQRPVQKLPEVTTNKSLYHMESILRVVLKEPQQQGTNSNHEFPGLFLETLSRASSAKDFSVSLIFTSRFRLVSEKQFNM